MTTVTTAIRMSIAPPHWYPASHQPNPIPRHRTGNGLEKRAGKAITGRFQSHDPEKPVTGPDEIGTPVVDRGHRSAPAHPRGNFGLVFCWQAPVGAAQTNVRAGRRHRTGPYRSPQRWCVRCSLSWLRSPATSRLGFSRFSGGVSLGPRLSCWAMPTCSRSGRPRALGPPLSPYLSGPSTVPLAPSFGPVAPQASPRLVTLCPRHHHNLPGQP